MIRRFSGDVGVTAYALSMQEYIDPALIAKHDWYEAEHL